MTRFACILPLCTGLFAAGAALAQSNEAPLGWLGLSDGLVLWQGGADLDGGGSFSARRYVLRIGGLYTFPNRVSAGIVSSGGQTDYDFGNAVVAPFGDVNEYRISLPVRFPVGDRAQALIVPSFRYDYEDGAASSDGFTWGAFGGISWQLSETLSIGPAVGIYSQLGDDDLDIFPALLIDWEFAPRWSLATGTAPGSTEGPGLSLSYQVTDEVKLSLAGRYENLQFRLDNTGLAPGGVGEDRSFPLVLAVDYSPAIFFRATAFLGAKLGGTMKVRNAAGTVVNEQDYDPAPVAGFAFRLFF